LNSANRLQHVQRAARVDLKIFDRIDETRSHRHLGGEVKHLRRIFDGLLDDREIAQVGHLDIDEIAMCLHQPAQIALDAGA
jgi:hypothetical protein